MGKTLTIEIRPAEKAREDFGASFKALEAGRPVRRREAVYFTSVEAARNLLTPNRLALLRAIRRDRPGSVYQLAKVLGRDLSNVQDDLRLLARYGLVKLTEGRSTGKRRVKLPEAVYDEIALRIAI